MYLFISCELNSFMGLFLTWRQELICEKRVMGKKNLHLKKSLIISRYVQRPEIHTYL